MTVDKSPATEELPFVWSKLAEHLQEDVSEDTFARWFKDVELVALSDTALTLRVPSHIYQLWIESNYMGLLRSGILYVLGRERAIHFAFASAEGVIDGEPAPPMPKKRKTSDAEAAEEEKPARVANGLNQRNTFDCFVVGAANQY